MVRPYNVSLRRLGTQYTPSAILIQYPKTL
jgi:hypothetical protein